ncbi:MAG: 50S ribosomal protein L23 [bacterium]|nr:50S ribosomal protein L23 [bacterium]
MAFFKKKKANTDKTTPPASKKSAANTEEKNTDASSSTLLTGRGLDPSMVLVRPHVTEKATDLAGRGVYAFDIYKSANKMQVREAVEKLYKVKPTRVNIMNKKPKLMRNSRTGRTQMKQAGMKKALVYLKSGDKIEFV